MKIYQVSLTDREGDESKGFEYRETLRGAKEFVAEVTDRLECEIRLLEIPVTKEGLLRALNLYGGHPNNG